MDRETGFYWVKWHGVWRVMHYFKHDREWCYSGFEIALHDQDLTDIQEDRILDPDEKSQK